MYKKLFAVCIIGISFIASASDHIKGTTVEFSSPNRIAEECIILDSMPGGIYSKEDHDTERRFCEMNVYSNTAMCPKTWSTSPGTLFYPLKGSPYRTARDFEKNVCTRQRKSPTRGIAFKNTMNMRDTSATFSTASLLYYHFSRYFDTQVKVPVSVYRSLDKDIHRQRVSHRGASISKSKMIHNAWKDMLLFEANPDKYHPTDELFTADRKQIYGVLVDESGKRYGPEINGSRKSSWGAEQSRDFQQTPPFKALRSAHPLAQTIKAESYKASDTQMAFWMRELIDITLLDYIFSQQDRIGNIDYKKIWVSKDGQGVVRYSKNRPADDSLALQIKQSHINDNDAGGRYAYANFTKKTGMLEKTRHYNAGTYTKLMKLDNDFRQQGELYQYLKNSFGLTAKQRDMIVKNTHLAADILRDSCRNNKLKFDLDPEQFYLNGKVTPVQQACDLFAEAEKPS